jgi:hypothetical protein
LHHPEDLSRREAEVYARAAGASHYAHPMEDGSIELAAVGGTPSVVPLEEVAGAVLGRVREGVAR